MEVKLLADGMEYAKPDSPPVRIKWADVQAIAYEWGPWYDDPGYPFPLCLWCFTTKDQTCLWIEDTEKTCSIMLPALTMNFPGFVGERAALLKMAWEKEFVDGKFRCWPEHFVSD